jgi:putative two-component system response regulator
MHQPADTSNMASCNDKPTIVVVDDDAMNISIMEEALGRRYNLILCRSGLEALERILGANVALVLLDIMMPHMDGYEVCRRIKQSARGSTTQVILVSAKASTAERVRGYEVGADDYITKPFEEDELHAKVRVHLRLRQALAELERAHDKTVKDNVRLQDIVHQQTHELMDARDLLVFAMAKLADSRDPETGAHLERMRAYSQLLAMELHRSGPYKSYVDRSFIDGIFLSSPLHDIGKVGIPDMILLKPGRLSEAEFEIMKRHSEIGASALTDVARRGGSGQFLTIAIEIARHHHERFDGSGYPDGLVGMAIPLSARIVAVADVFDAITSARVYKDAFSVEVACSMIRNESKRHFDPVVVNAFLQRFDELVQVRERFVDETAFHDAA